MLRRIYIHYRRRLRYAFRGTYYSLKYRLTGNNEVSIAGVTLDLSPDRISSRMVSTIRTSMYESQEARLLRSHLHEGLPLIDLGAGIGFLSCLGAELGADSMGSVAVEADASLIPIIEHTRALNDADFTIVNRAYHPGEDEIDVHIRSDFWSSSSFRRAVSADRKVTVATADLSGIIDDFGVTRPYQLVVDIEGGEYDLLLHELDELVSDCKFLVAELHYFTEHDPDDFRTMLEEHGFSCVGAVENVFAFENTDIAI